MRGWKPALAGKMTRQTDADGLKWSLLKQILKVRGVHAALDTTMLAMYSRRAAKGCWYGHDRELWRPPRAYRGSFLGECGDFRQNENPQHALCLQFRLGRLLRSRPVDSLLIQRPPKITTTALATWAMSSTICDQCERAASSTGT